jgi:hypothetical protein
MNQFTKDNGCKEPILDKEEENAHGKMELCTKVIGWIANQMDTAESYMQTVISLKASLKMTWRTVSVK